MEIISRSRCGQYGGALWENIVRCEYALSDLLLDGRSATMHGAIPNTSPISLHMPSAHYFFSIDLQGPRGELERTLPSLVTLEQEGNILKVLRVNETRQANAQHGLARSLVSNMVVGVSDGFTKTLSLVGVGYKAAATGDNLTLNLGYSHPIEMDVPKGIEVKVERNTTVIVSGSDKELVGQFAANVRSKREPEPYKGKGVRYVDEYVRRKEGKRGK